MDYATIREMLKGLITDSTPTEVVEGIGKVSGAIDEVEKQEGELIKSHEELRRKYIEAIKQTSFREAPKEESEPQPKSLEECFAEEIAKRKE